MSSLVLELQREALEKTSSISNLLRKAYVIAKKLEVRELEIWTSCELDGYDSKIEIPKYRFINIEIKSHNPYNGIWMPLTWNGKAPEWATRQPISQKISELEHLTRHHDDKEGGLLYMNFSSTMQAKLMSLTDMVSPPVMIVSKTGLVGIIESVRNLVLDWTLKLESKGILGNNMTFTPSEKESALRNHSSITIQNFQGVLGDITQSNVSLNLTMEIKPRNFDSLSKVLIENGIDKTSIADLQSALELDPKPIEGGKFGKNVSAWVGRMVSKASDGSWQIAIGTAANLLSEAIIKYYGH